MSLYQLRAHFSKPEAVRGTLRLVDSCYCGLLALLYTYIRSMGLLPDRNRLVAWCFAALLLNTAYIAAFAEPTVFYMGNVLAILLAALYLRFSR